MKPAAARPLRADAERNRTRVLEVAAEVFSKEGLAVPIDEIARRAGLGIGTLYRHFPTKEALFAAIVVSGMEHLVADARIAQESDAPGEAFFAFLTRLAHGWKKKKGLMEALASAGVDLKDVARVKHDLHVELGKLLDRARHSGAIRDDVSIQEILTLLGGVFASVERQDITSEGRDRMLAVIFDGLRTPKK